MPKVVKGVFIKPTDKTNPAASAAISRCLRHLQCWYHWQMGNGKTFTLGSPVVTVVNSTHASSWFSTNPAGGDPQWYFWNNVLADAASLAGVGYGQETSWAVYVDAAPAAGQGTGGASVGSCGIAVLDAKDIRAICGIDTEWKLCRGIGSSGHQLGHTFGLPHPPSGDAEWSTALMGRGYTKYAARAILRDADKDLLNANPFFSAVSIGAPPAGCPFFLRTARSV